MGGIERVRNLDAQFEQLFNLEWTALDLVLERGTVQILYSDEGLTRFLAYVINGADIGMVQGRSRLGLALEAGQRLSIAGNLIRHLLESDKAVQPGVFGFVDNAHTPTTDLLDNAVMRDGPADHWRSMLLVVKPASQRKSAPGGGSV